MEAPLLSPSLLLADVGIVIVRLTVLDTKSASSVPCVAVDSNNRVLFICVNKMIRRDVSAQITYKR